MDSTVYYLVLQTTNAKKSDKNSSRNISTPFSYGDANLSGFPSAHPMSSFMKQLYVNANDVAMPQRNYILAGYPKTLEAANSY